MVNVTDIAKLEIAKLIEKQKTEIVGVRVKAEPMSPLRANFRLAFVQADQVTESDKVLDFDGFNVYVDEASEPFAQDITLDFVDRLMGRGFKIDNPNKIPPHLKGTIAEKIQTVIDDQINPSIAAHGGHVSLVDIKEDTVYLQFGGGCQGCGMVDVTLKQGVEVLLKEHVPEVREVRDITDHESGENPYYESKEQ